MEHIGIDLHTRESQICILTSEGELIERRIQSTRQRFTALFKGRALYVYMTIGFAGALLFGYTYRLL